MLIISLEFEAIREDLERLRKTRVSPTIFGADEHKYILNEPVTEAVLTEFEAKHAIHLPADYRQFLTEVGNGGAGPYYGVFKLGEMDHYSGWTENDGFVGDLSKPFPHTEAWNDLADEPDPGTDDDEAYEEQLTVFEERYWSSENVNGAIPICHLGCALRQWLIVTGVEAGHIWCDERVDRKGLFPLSGKTGERVTFYRWYRDWLDEALRQLEALENKL